MKPAAAIQRQVEQIDSRATPAIAAKIGSLVMPHSTSKKIAAINP
jgi:hypothetical protein